MTDDGMVKLLMEDARDRMQGSIDALDADLGGYRTGRASTALVDRLEIDYYGTATPLNQMATISVPEPRLIAIRVWDVNAVPQIEKGIMASDLGLMPSIDGQVIRLSIPALTEERREELTKLASRRVEEAKIAIRNVRRDVLHHLEDLDLPEDRLYMLKDEVQEMTDKFIEQADGHGEAKFAEIREV
jgi:ribosome recycling factor